MLSALQIQLAPPKNWQDFENLCHELFRAEWNDPFAQKHGRPGHGQQGVDVYGIVSQQGGYVGVQCKCREILVQARVTPSQLRREVGEATEFEPRLRQFIVATTQPRDPKLQREARQITERHQRKGLFPVAVFSWDDITDMLDRHPQIAARYYGLPHAYNSAELSPTGTLTMPPPPIASAPTADVGVKSVPAVLPLQTSHALGLIAVGPVPLSEGWLKQFFPDVAWSRELKSLAEAGAVSCSNGLVLVDDRVAKSFLPTAAEREVFVNKWIDALTPLKMHVDTALLLGIQQMRLGRIREAVSTIVDIALELEPGHWNRTYRETLLACHKPKVLRVLAPEERVALYDAVGRCFARSDRPLEAVPWFQRLRRYCRRVKNAWGEGQSYIDEGVARLEAGDCQKARGCLDLAVKHAKKHGDKFLLGRALYDLATLEVETDPDKAERLLELSIAAKKAARDNPKGATPLFCRGQIAVRRGDHAMAFKWFSRAEKAACRTDDRDARATALCNMAKAQLDLDEPKIALPLYVAARKLAEEEGCERLLVLALQGEAYTRHTLRQHARAAAAFRRVHTLLDGMGQYEGAAIALHDAAVMLSRSGDPSATAVIQQAARYARQHELAEWLYRCRRDESVLAVERGDPATARRILNRAVTDEARKGNTELAARLREALVDLLIQHSPSVPDIEKAFSDAFAAWERTQDSSHHTCRMYEALYSWRWSSGRFDEAMKALRDLARFASRRKLYLQQGKALDQLGTSLQELGLHVDAETAHRRALEIAGRARDQRLRENALNNLGELFRTTGRPDESLKSLREAELLAEKRGDAEAAVSIAHNRALALFASGKRAAARRLLMRCRDVAERSGWHGEYVRAQHGLANFAWELNQPKEAERLYRQALLEAERCALKDHVWPLALNYGNVFRWKKQPKRALRYFELAAESCNNPAEVHQCLQQLAACRHEAGDSQGARKAWALCRDAAKAANDRGTVALASASLANSYAEMGRFAEAERDIRRALQFEDDPTDRVYLLHDQLNILLAAGKERAAGRVFREIRAAAQADDELTEVLVDAHVTLGDHNWADGRSLVEALRAFVAALSLAYRVDLDSGLELGARLAGRIMSLPRKGRSNRIREYEEELTRWLRRELSGRPSSLALKYLLWPLRVARRLTNEPHDGKSLSHAEVGRLIGEEMGVSR